MGWEEGEGEGEGGLRQVGRRSTLTCAFPKKTPVKNGPQGLVVVFVGDFREQGEPQGVRACIWKAPRFFGAHVSFSVVYVSTSVI